MEKNYVLVHVHRSKIANSDKIPMKVRSIYTVGQALLCPLRIGEKHPRNGGVSAPLTSGACDCLSQCLYPARGIIKIKVIRISYKLKALKHVVYKK
jgi:hypothetical protein